MGSRSSAVKDQDSSSTMDTVLDVNNGLILNNVFLPEEMLIQILLFVDQNSLVFSGRLVCKAWRRLIECSVLKSKVDDGPYHSLSTVEPALRHSLHLHWSIYYLICEHDHFDKNLLLNPSGKEGLKYWKITENGGDQWIVEESPEGVSPLPETDMNSPCFVTSYHDCHKNQIIPLVKHGFSSKIMDEIQPTISIRELYSARFDCGGVHEICVTLLDKDKKPITQFQKTDFPEDRMNWHEVRHEFRNYGPGVRFIQYHHGGRDTQFWAGHYGIKIAGSSVRLIFPAPTQVLETEDDLEDSAL